jgi:predicted transcriptional regulator
MEIALTDDTVAAPDFLELTANIVSAFVASNKVAAAELVSLIASVDQALRTASNGSTAPAKIDLVPAVPIRKSVTADYIISLEDGRKFKSLKRHLRTNFDMSPDQYRAKWGLPADYPMVAPNYAKTRSDLAKSLGLGQKGKGRAARLARSEPVVKGPFSTKPAPKPKRR